MPYHFNMKISCILVDQLKSNDEDIVTINSKSLVSNKSVTYLSAALELHTLLKPLELLLEIDNYCKTL